MRIKSIGGKARFSKMAIPKPSSIPRSVSLLNQEDHNLDDGIDSIVPETPSDGEDGLRDGVIPDRVVGAKKAPSLDIFHGDFMDIDSLEDETCIKCGGDGPLLVCCEIGCPLAVHEKCMGSELIFDDMGKFYCPYCLYKRDLARIQELRRKAMAAKKALSSFLDSEAVGSDKGKEKGRRTDAAEPDVSLLDGNRNHLDRENSPDDGTVEIQFGQAREPCDQHREVVEDQNGQEEMIQGIGLVQDNIEKEKEGKDKISERRQREILEDGEGVQAEDSKQHEDRQHEGVVEDKQQAEPSNACHIEEDAAMDGSLNASTKQAEDNAQVSEESPCRKKEQVQPQVQEKTSSSIRGGSELNVPTNANVGVDNSDSDTEIPLRHQRRVKQRTRNAASPQNAGSTRKPPTRLKVSAEENARNQMEDHTTSKESTYITEKNVRNHKEEATTTTKSKQQESPQQNRTSCGGRRKKVYWKEEEEDMLKEGVHKFSSTVNKNIPWRKILDFGHHIFDPTRTPADLKDKWKKLVRN